MIFPKYTVFLAVLLLIMFYLSPEHQLWYLDVHKIQQGEYWRLVSGHLIHADNEHLLLNLFALLVLGFVIEKNSSTHLWLSMVGVIVVLNIFLLSAWSSLDIYCGFSGVLNGLLITALYSQMQKQNSLIFIVIGGLCFLKIIWEIIMGQALISTISWPSYPYAHLIGFVSGLFMEILKNFNWLKIRNA